MKLGMRHGVGAFGVACSAVLIFIAAQYGYKTSDNDADGYVWAFIYGSITAAGLFGHMVAVRLWRYGKRVWAALVFVTCLIALAVSLTNSVGAMAGRMSEKQSKILKHAQDMRELARSLKDAKDERRELRFKGTDQAAVSAAKAKADAATQARKTECQGVQDSRCIKKQEVEQAALTAYTDALQDMKMTARAAELDTTIANLADKSENSEAVKEANTQGSALARLFGLPDDSAGRMLTYQNFGMAIVLELLVAFSLMVYEVMTEHETALENAAKALQEAATLAEAKPALKKPAKAVKAVPVMVALPQEEEPKAFPAPPRPRLISSQSSPMGSVPLILAEIMEPGTGKVELRELFSAYRAGCQAKGKEPIPANEFSGAVAALCKRLGIQIEDDGTGIYLLNVRLKTSEQKLEGQAS